MVRGGLSLILLLVLAWLLQSYRAWQAADSDGREYLPLTTAVTATYGVEIEGDQFLVDLEVQPRGEGALYVETWRRSLDTPDGADVLHVRSAELKGADSGIIDSTGKMVLPLLHRDKPRSWKATCEGDLPLWPLLAWFPDEVPGAGSPGSAKNPIDREEIQFFQQAPERLDWGQGSVECFRLHYLGHRSQPGSVHRIEGRLWLAPGIGVAREERTVRHETRQGDAAPHVSEVKIVRALRKSKDRS